MKSTSNRRPRGLLLRVDFIGLWCVLSKYGQYKPKRHPCSFANWGNGLKSLMQLVNSPQMFHILLLIT